MDFLVSGGRVAGFLSPIRYRPSEEKRGHAEALADVKMSQVAAIRQGGWRLEVMARAGGLGAREAGGGGGPTEAREEAAEVKARV
ncbi:uncharacterized protein VTP21DRAFT_5399 [Calcarisporiella thermophila]|uniref:uncharacterized protein n=1 Tax=Calcarisporiella thermophila TaxID=911321 RepID=UPI003743E57C